MTHEEAIAILKTYDVNFYNNDGHKIRADKICEALDMAIKALEQEPRTGHWKRISMDKYSEHAKYWYRCDRCNKDNLGNTDFCPNCGARMEGEQNG